MSVVMDKYDTMEEEQANYRVFSVVFAASQFLGAVSVILVAVWMGSYGGGFGWSGEPDLQFHYHPLFMTIGMIFLYGEAILVYRVFRHERKRFTKLLHIVLHSMIFVFFVVALQAVFQSHNSKGVDNMYTLHSYVGLATVLLFCLQYVCGFVAFFFPGLSHPVRKWYLPIHQAFGAIIFILAVGSALMGIAERSAWHIFNGAKDKHGQKLCPGSGCSEGRVANFLGISILLYAMSVLYLVVNPKYRRRPLPEEESMQQLTSD